VLQGLHGGGESLKPFAGSQIDENGLLQGHRTGLATFDLDRPNAVADGQLGAIPMSMNRTSAWHGRQAQFLERIN